MNKLCECGCGNEVKCASSRFCSGHQSRSTEYKRKCKETCLERYGVEFSSQVKENRDKCKETCLERYGVEFSSRVKENRDKYKHTCLERYGVQNPSLDLNVKEKKKITCLKNNGVEHPMQSKDVLNKSIITSLKRYGTRRPFQNKEVQNKAIKTWINNLGVNNPSQDTRIKEKKESTCLKNHNVKNPFQSEKIKEKIKNKLIEKYGADHFSKTGKGRMLCRINFLNLIKTQQENNEPLTPIIGTYERLCFQELQKNINYEIKRPEENFLGYFPDGHISELKLFIEFDERHHFTDYFQTYTDRDKRRESELASLGYIIHHIKLNDWLENKDQIINQFKELISLLQEGVKQ